MPKTIEDFNSFIDGCLLGDASILKSYCTRDDTYNYQFSLSHSPKQETYLLWKKDIISKLGFNVGMYERDRTSYLKGRKISSTEKWIRFSNKEFLVPIRDRWYPDDKKQVPGDICLTPESIAIWYMDDGCYHMFRGTALLATYGFNLQSQHLLQSELRKFNINASIAIKKNAGSKYYFIYLPRTEAWKLLLLVEPYISPDLSYKVPNGYDLFRSGRRMRGKTLSCKILIEDAKAIIIDNFKEFEAINGKFDIIPYLYWEKSFSHKPIQRIFGSFFAAINLANLRYSPCYQE